MEFPRQLVMRYVGQSYELGIAVDDPKFSAPEMERLSNRFHEEHERSYGFKAPEEPVEIVNLRLNAIGMIAKPRLREIHPQQGGLKGAILGSREVYFLKQKDFRNVQFMLGTGLVQRVSCWVRLLFRRGKNRKVQVHFFTYLLDFLNSFYSGCECFCHYSLGLTG